MENRDWIMAKRIAARVAAEGGRTFLVGGAVRDRILGRENKDIDIEVHGVTPQRLEKILDSLGSRTQMGADFGIFGLRGYDLDIAMPRKEEATGRGHKDFRICVDPFLGTQKAAKRRDFTMNALMQDVLTGEIIDHFGGIQDARDGVLRHVNAETFVEDPLRVLRAAQFAARFGFRVADATVALARTMDLSALARERILGELEKAMKKAPKPSVFFEELRRMNQLSVWFPEIEQLAGVRQNPRYHPEGDVWTHTMLVLDAAAAWREQTENPMGFMLAALTHDLGKIVATVEINGELHAYGHERQGLPLTKRFLQRITNETKLIRYVMNLDELHRMPGQLAAQRSREKVTNAMFDQAADPLALLLLARADAMGKPGAERDEEAEKFLEERLELFRQTMEKPYVMGADLVAAGLKPGPEFSEILSYAHKLRLAGIGKEDALKQTLAYAASLPGGRRDESPKGENGDRRADKGKNME